MRSAPPPDRSGTGFGTDADVLQRRTSPVRMPGTRRGARFGRVHAWSPVVAEFTHRGEFRVQTEDRVDRIKTGHLELGESPRATCVRPDLEDRVVAKAVFAGIRHGRRMGPSLPLGGGRAWANWPSPPGSYLRLFVSPRGSPGLNRSIHAGGFRRAGAACAMNRPYGSIRARRAAPRSSSVVICRQECRRGRTAQRAAGRASCSIGSSAFSGGEERLVGAGASAAATRSHRGG